ncbi:MAG: YceI family protein [Bacteroidetes bacterium]|nr:MAG: YceI family protein [Bacteroidota bacterium]
MKKLILSLLLAGMITPMMFGQKIFTREGKISFYSEAQKESIQAHNSKATSIIDVSSGRMEFAVLIKAFQFEKALMQEHFNENYMESSKFPKAVFKGEINNLEAIDFKKDGTYPADIKGNITIHGVTKPIEAKGSFVVSGNSIKGESTFEVTIADFDIEIPALVRENIAKVIRIDVSCNYVEFKKS